MLASGTVIDAMGMQLVPNKIRTISYHAKYHFVCVMYECAAQITQEQRLNVFWLAFKWWNLLFMNSINICLSNPFTVRVSNNGSNFVYHQICSHFKRMYTKPGSMEQILHNNIIVVQALTILSLNMDIYVSRGL